MSKVHLVSYSEIDTLRQCPHKHVLSYRERWVGQVTGPALIKGTRWHAIMECHYNSIKNSEEAGIVNEAEILRLARREVKKMLVLENGFGDEIDELVMWMYDGHCEYYGIDPDWKVLAVEHAAQVWLPTPTGTRSRFKLKLKMDLVVRERSTKNLLVVDHKSGKDLPNSKEFDIDDQFGLYTWAMRSLGKPVFGSIHSAARTHRNKDQSRHPQPLNERFRRTTQYRTDAELDTIAVEAYRTIRAGYQWHPDEAPRSPNTDTCRWRCDYTDACLMGRKLGPAREREMLTDLGFEQNFERH